MGWPKPTRNTLDFSLPSVQLLKRGQATLLFSYVLPIARKMQFPCRVQQVSGEFDECLTHFLRELVRGMVEVGLIPSRYTASTIARHLEAPSLFSSGKARSPQTEKGLCFRKSPLFLSQRTLRIWHDTIRKRARRNLASFDQSARPVSHL